MDTNGSKDARKLTLPMAVVAGLLVAAIGTASGAGIVWGQTRADVARIATSATDHELRVRKVEESAAALAASNEATHSSMIKQLDRIEKKLDRIK